MVERADLRLGEKITVVDHWMGPSRIFARATVTGTLHMISYRARVWTGWRFKSLDSVVPIQAEGVTWCRGWKGPAVDALKAVVALVQE